MTTRRLAWTQEAWDDYVFWQTQDRKTLKRINTQIADVLRTPFAGIGKPEALPENLSGLLARRLHPTNRLGYAVDAEQITIISGR